MKLGSTCTTSTSPDGHVTTHNNDGTTSDTDLGPRQPSRGRHAGERAGRVRNDTAIDPLTGQPAGGDVTSADGALTTASGTPVALAGSRSGQQHALGWLVAAMLALTVLAPPFLIARHGRRQK